MPHTCYFTGQTEDCPSDAEIARLRADLSSARDIASRWQLKLAFRASEAERLRAALRDLIEAGSRGSADFDAEAKRAEHALASAKAR